MCNVHLALTTNLLTSYIPSHAFKWLLHLNGFSIESVWEIFEVAYLSVEALFVASSLGFGGLHDDIIFYHVVIIMKVFKEIEIANSTHPNYRGSRAYPQENLYALNTICSINYLYVCNVCIVVR